MTIIPLFIAIALIFGLCILLMAIGLIVRGKIMRGGCGSHNHGDEAITCETCSKKTINLCDEDDDMGLADVSNTSTMGRFSKKP